MLLSEDITKNKKFPSIMRDAKIFKDHNKFEKVFPHIGLPNFMQPLTKSLWQIPFILTHGAFYMRLNMGGIEHTGGKIVWGLVGIPLNTAMLTFDALCALKFRARNKGMKLVFSADGKDGAWDIATMSMRGIKSCQSWGLRRASSLVGSVADPCCAIIYLTDGKETSHGSKMNHRALVRYVVHDKFGPALFIERLYSADPVSENTQHAITFIFALALHNRTGLPIIENGAMFDTNDIANRTIFIPRTEVDPTGLYRIGGYDYEDYSSYRDSGIYYGCIEKGYSRRFSGLHKIKGKVFPSEVSHA